MRIALWAGDSAPAERCSGAVEPGLPSVWEPLAIAIQLARLLGGLDDHVPLASQLGAVNGWWAEVGSSPGKRCVVARRHRLDAAAYRTGEDAHLWLLGWLAPTI